MSRLAPELPLPSYAYVPGGLHPHPTRDPRGHSYGRVRSVSAAPDPAYWEDCQLYRYGIDLFNHGYYWEAHEAWESLWHACGRQGITADFLKALIALTSAGVKQQEGMIRGVLRHAERCRALLEGVTQQIGQDQTHYLGLELRMLAEITRRLSAGEPVSAESLSPLLDSVSRPACLNY